MFLKPSDEVKSKLNEISRTRKQLIRERNATEHRTSTVSIGRSLRPDSALSYWKNKLLPSGLLSRKPAIERGLSFAKLRRLKAISGGRLRNMNNGKFSGKRFLVLKMGHDGLLHIMGNS
ncbi:hypothetical protein AAC387_Pa08g1183 [Persea americana]